MTLDWLSFALESVKYLGPALLGGLFGFLAGRRQLQGEKLKLEHGDRVAANKRLFVFARQLQGRVFPLAEDKESKFVDLMLEEYFTGLHADAIHLSDVAESILADVENIYYCATKPELISETEDSRKRFFDDLFDKARTLASEARSGANT